MRASFLFAFLLVLSLNRPAFPITFSTDKDDEGVTVKIDGQLFTRYVFKSGAKPILWPVIGPTGKEMTRAWPLRTDDAAEAKDHVHQRSFWFTHGEVNGVSFWDEMTRHGDIKHRELREAKGGETARIVTSNDWVGPDGTKHCEDQRTITCGATKDLRWIDFEIVLRAADKPVVFGDTKEGAFGLRVAHSLAVDSKQGGKIVSSEGLTDAAAWGKKAAWVDYHGPLAGETVGIAIMNHPSSLRYPTEWHVRPYGLFAANPFGAKSFSGKKDAAAPDGSLKLDKGQSAVLRYRVLLHRGDEKQANLADEFKKYALLDFDKP